MSDLTPNKFAFIIENMVKEKKISYMDAILDYCKTHEIDPSNTKSMINKTLKEKDIEPKNNRRVIGVGSQILRLLDLKKITVLGTPTKYSAVSGFDIEITGFENE